LYYGKRFLEKKGRKKRRRQQVSPFDNREGPAPPRGKSPRKRKRMLKTAP